MAIAVASVTQTLVGASDTTPTFNMPATRPDGDLYIVVVASSASFGTPTLTGWTRLNTTAGGLVDVEADEGQASVGAWYRIGSSEPANYTGSGWPNTEYVFHVYHLTGADNTFDASSSAATGASTTSTAPDATPSRSGCLVIRAWAIDVDNPTGSAPAGHISFNGSSSSAGGAGSAYGGTAIMGSGVDPTYTTSSVPVGTAVMGGTYDDNWAAFTLIACELVPVMPPGLGPLPGMQEPAQHADGALARW